ncbi:hypothetical protein BSI_25670 [Bacillus inaquosorum KCTC 13429]|uniref:Uncharacterized protein n=1 Tax=Bacillus inaquosorum KCTC 13429 TaxID=1236548 RepID=A0A9W5LI23_9BACI|nr:hypothetical protein BSI_25670 [Bacillus inaquosorum KCTC 13429]
MPAQKRIPQHDILQKAFPTRKNTIETETKITQADSGIHRRISAQFIQYPLLKCLNITVRKMRSLTFEADMSPLIFSHTYVHLS